MLKKTAKPAPELPPDEARASELVARATTRPARPSDEHTEEWGYSGREWMRRVTYVARGGLIPDDYCVMSIVPLHALRLEHCHAAGVPEAPSQEDISGDIARGKP